MADFIVLLREWQAEGFVLEEAAGGHIHTQPWWLTLTELLIPTELRRH